MHRGAIFASSLVALLAIDEAARADTCRPTALTSTCINDDTFWPHAGAQQFVGVGGADTTGDGRIGFALVTDYLSRPIVFTIPSPSPSGTKQYAIDDQVNGTFLWSYGMTKRLELDLAVPITFGQGGSGIEPITAGSNRLHDTAVRDIRFGASYAIVPRVDRVWGLTARFEASAPTGDHDQFAGDRAVVFVPSIAADYRRGRWFAGAELGVRARPNESLLGATVGTQGVVGVGVGYDLLKTRDLLGVMIEARSLPTFAKQRTATETTAGIVLTDSSAILAPSEWMLAVRSSPLKSKELDLQLGGGGPIPTGDADLTVPRFRFVLGVRFTPTDRPKPRDAAAPVATPPPPPPMRLDLASAKDVCTDDPDTVDGFLDRDGCPDEDADKDGVDDRYDKCPLASEDFAGLADGCPNDAAAPSPKRAPEKP